MDEFASAPVRPDVGLNIDFSFRHGWCNLIASTGEATVEVQASTLYDSFSRLTWGINQLLSGNECVSIIWGGEGRGCFIDLSIDVADNIGFVVHNMKNPRWLSPADSWMPIRGEAMFQAYSAANHFCRSYGSALRRVRIEYADATDYMEHWGWSFPVDEYLRFERHASRKGYRPSMP
jgi:hypothetical protein